MKWRSLDESNAVDLRPLREIYAERKALIEKYVPAETTETHARAAAELKAKGIASRALAAGATAPPFELKNHDGNLASSAELLNQGRLVVCFIRGRWCPFCVGQMEAMNLIVPEIQKAGASLVGISPQTVQQSYFMHDQHKLRFPLLSDAGNDVARRFGLVYRVPDYQETLYRRVFVNLPHANGDESWELPIAATFVVERDGRVMFASANENYMERPEPSEILQMLLKAAA
ncbi:MAG TPA: peroxiredoxin-like family protein [Terriglobales bacterium]|jgi:peroxiredoxin